MSEERAKSLLPVNPLTAYDVLGYLVPGGSLLLCAFAFEYWARQEVRVCDGPLHTPVYTIMRALMPTAESTSWAIHTVGLLALVMLSYIIGHVVASISAIAIERFYVAKGHGYPFRALLAIPDPPNANPSSKPFHRALFLWVNVYLLARHMTRAASLSVPEVSGWQWGSAADILGWIVVALVVFKIMVSARYGRHDTWIRRCLSTKAFLVVAWPMEKIILALSLPASVLASFFANYLNTRNAFSKEQQTWYKTKFPELFIKESSDTAGSTNFWWALTHVRRVAPILAEPAENWLRLYSFARNLAAALFLAFVYSAFFWWTIQSPAVEFASTSSARVFFFGPVALWIAACAMLLRYYYLYADYFTKYVFRTFLYLTTPAGETRPHEEKR